MKLFDFTADKNKLSSQITESISVNEEESVNESLQALAKHVKEGTALCDSPFRHGSKAYIETFQLAKKLREAGSLPELDWESEEMLATDIGEQVTLKGGEKVWLDIPYLIEDEDNGMIGEPDDYYDAEEREEAYRDLKKLEDEFFKDHERDGIRDGICPACGGNGYMDGEEEVYNDETNEYEEGTECDGYGNFGCDEGEMTYGSDGPSWVEIIRHDERKADRQKSKDEYPGDEEVIKQVASYMKQMDDPRMAYQQMQADFPFMGRGQRSDILGKASKLAFGEAMAMPTVKNTPQENDVCKILGKALGKDEQESCKFSPQELYSELESINPELADTIARLSKIVYDVKLEERVYKDVGVADVQKDARGKEFKFDKDKKQFKSISDPEVADIKTKLGKDLMKKRKSSMRKSTPSYNKKPAPKKPGFIASLFNDIEG